MINRGSVPLDTGMRDRLELDVAIIGGGVAGLYTGFRLLEGQYKEGARKPTAPKVHIFELSDRIGGRLYSVRLPGMSVTGELGGMRYLTSQEIVTSLIEQVFADRLQHAEFSMGSPAHLFFYLRQQRFRANAWANAQKKRWALDVRYFLEKRNAGLSPDQLFNKIIYDVLMADRHVAGHYRSQIIRNGPYDYEFKLTRLDWAAIKPVLRYNFEGPYNGMRVAEMGFWNLVRDQVSEEGYEFLSDGNGYYSMTINWNAAEAFPYTVGDFTGKNVAYRTIQGGYDQIAYALAQAFTGHEGATIWGGNRLVDIEKSRRSKRHRYRLTIANAKSQRQWTVYANRVVLAMPRRSLELINQQNFFFNPSNRPEMQHRIKAALLEPSFKLLLGFTEPWWKQDFGAVAGESITDLPMRQCYYFGTDPKDSHSLFMASYNDMRTVGFWRALQRGPLFEPKRTRLARKADLDALRSVQAPQMMVHEAMKEVRQLHGHLKRPIPDPYVSYFKDWGEDPFGAGYHGWRAAADVKTVMEYMRRPDPREHIHICGEAYSEQQGWVEGSLCVAEKMLQEHFGLRWPSWLDRAYFLGW